MDKNTKIILKAIEKSTNNSEFKELLVSDYKSAIDSLGLGVLKFEDRLVCFIDSTHSDFSEDFIQETESSVIISIPKSLEVDNVELSDVELEAVSGGDFTIAVLMWYARRKARKAGEEAAAKAK